MIGYLTRLAGWANCALVLIHHIRKTNQGQSMLSADFGMEDLSGSGYITQAARVVLGLRIVQTGPEFDPNGPREFKMLRNNLGTVPAPLGFSFAPLHPEGVVLKWQQAAPQVYREPSRLDDCKEWLEDLLRTRPEGMRPKEVEELGLEMGFKRSMIHLARKELRRHIDNSAGRQAPNNTPALWPISKTNADSRPKPSAPFAWVTTRPTCTRPPPAGVSTARKSGCRAASSSPVSPADSPGTSKSADVLAGDALGQHIGAWTPKDGLGDVKFGGPRGGLSCLFRLELRGHLPVLFLVEGEWDTMLVWEYAPDLCDSATLGGAGAKLDLLDLSLLTCYAAIIAVYDDDAAGDKGRAYLSELQKKIPRIRVVHPPAHDLTDFWKSGGALRQWLAGQVANALQPAVTTVCPQDWQKVAALATAESSATTSLTSV